MPWDELRQLMVGTGQLWWRLLPRTLAIWLLGWLGSELALRLALVAGDVSPWFSLILFAFNFVCVLAAAILILSAAGRELGIRGLLPVDEREDDDRDTSVSRLLAITLLPFLGMYAAFGQVSEAAGRLKNGQIARYGLLTDQPTVLGVLHDLAAQHVIRLLVLLAALYVGRRLVDRLHERTGVGALGLVVVLIESFFMLLLIMGGVRVFQQFQLWLGDRVVASWAEQGYDAVARFLSVFRIDLPQIVVAVGSFFAEQVWPIFVGVLSAPLLWLAVAALVYGSRVLSLAELWRKGQPYAQRAGQALQPRIPGADQFAAYRERRAYRRLTRRLGPPPKGIRLAASQLQEALLGDLNDKYLPTLHSLRLVLRSSVGFLGAYVLAYSVIVIARNYWSALLHQLIGGQPGTFWVRWEPLVLLAEDLPFEPLRLCLLAVAFARCLQIFRDRTAPVQPDGDLVAPGPAESTR